MAAQKYANKLIEKVEDTIIEFNENFNVYFTPSLKEVNLLSLLMSNDIDIYCLVNISESYFIEYKKIIPNKYIKTYNLLIKKLNSLIHNKNKKSKIKLEHIKIDNLEKEQLLKKLIIQDNHMSNNNQDYIKELTKKINNILNKLKILLGDAKKHELDTTTFMKTLPNLFINRKLEVLQRKNSIISLKNKKLKNILKLYSDYQFYSMKLMSALSIENLKIDDSNEVIENANQLFDDEIDHDD